MIDVNNIEITANGQIDQSIVDGLLLLWSTPVGTVVLDRDFGIDMGFVDMPLMQAKQMFTVEIITKTRKYEPRVSVKKIAFTTNALDGKLTPKIEIGE